MSALRKSALAIATAMMMAQPAGAETITVMNFAGYWPEDLPERFKAATGIEVDMVAVGSNEETMSRIVTTNGKGFDVVFLSNSFAEGLNLLGLLEPLDREKLPNASNLYEEATKLDYDPGNTYSMPYAWGTTGFCYRSDLVSYEPTSWNDLLDPPEELRGKVTMLPTDRWLIAPAQIVNNFSVNEAGPEQLDAVKETLIKAKKTLLTFDGTTFFSKLVAGEALLTHGWDVYCNYAITENADVKYVVPKEGTDLWVDVMVIPKATEHSDAAHKLINFILQPENQLWVAENILSKVPNKASMGMLSEEMLTTYPNLTMTPEELGQFENFRDLGADTPAVSRAITEIMAAR